MTLKQFDVNTDVTASLDASSNLINQPVERDEKPPDKKVLIADKYDN
jgi:hypothetical protein